VARLRIFLKYWVPALLWMLLIFSASSDAGSFQRSSRFLAPLIRWFFPEMPEDDLFALVTFARKCAHAVEYAILSALLWRALRQPRRSDARDWSRRDAVWAFALASAYAVTDELHQHFVPNRQGSVWDVLLDSFGAALGIAVVWMLFRWRNRRS
jgi:VanZ family protein